MIAPPRTQRSWGRLAVVVAAAAISGIALFAVILRVQFDPRQGSADALLARDLQEPSRHFTPFTVRTIPPPRYASGSIALIAESDPLVKNPRFFHGVVQYRFHWYQFDDVKDAEEAHAKARDRSGWRDVEMPSEIGGGFYRDGYCITQHGRRWQCLHREDATLIVGDVILDSEVNETPFAPHHALQTGTKGWIAVHDENEASRRRGIFGWILIAMLPWALVAGLRWRRRLDAR